MLTKGETVVDKESSGVTRTNDLERGKTVEPLNFDS